MKRKSLQVRFGRQFFATTVTMAVGGAVAAWGLRGEIVGAVALVTLSRRAQSNNTSWIPKLKYAAQAALVGLMSGGIAVGTFTSGVWRPAKRIAIPFGKPPLILLWLGVVLLAVLNASLEEFIWRRLVVNLLQTSGVRPILTGALQAVSFGIAHVGGVPGGLPGVILTTGFALALHRIVKRSRTIAAGVLAHGIADIAIFLYLLHGLTDFRGQGLRYG